MKPVHLLPLASVVLLSAVLAAASGGGETNVPAGSPIYGVTIPDGYRRWELIAPALESAPLNELRVVVGNEAALGAYRAGTLPFPDGTVLVKLAWKSQHELPNKKNVERSRREVRNDQRQERINPTQRFIDSEQRNQRDLRRHHQSRDQKDEQSIATFELHPGKTESD